MSVKIEKRATTAILRMDKPRANAIDGAFVEDMTRAVMELEEDAEIKGILLASAHPRVFCPGLDLVGLLELDRAGMKDFMKRFARMVQALYGSSRPIVAALGGHAVAGGCVLALTADYRVIVRGANIGLNEVRVGVPLPWTVATLLKASIRPERLSEVALLGRNFADESALDVGLVHELVDADCEATSLERLAEFAFKDAVSIAKTKRALRAEVLDAMKAHEEEYLDEWIEAWFSDSTRSRIREIVAGMGKAK